jgi:hypothetical protein
MRTLARRATAMTVFAPLVQRQHDPAASRRGIAVRNVHGVADQSRTLNLVLLQKGFDILGEGGVVVSRIMRRFAMVAQVLDNRCQRWLSQTFRQGEVR